MSVRVRIAPSPTGKLHVGNVRTALMNWLFARQHQGVFMLRIDDTDLARSTKDFEEAIFRDFKWLGLEWQETAKQSERFADYDRARDSLIGQGLLYPCYETEDELDRKRKIAQSRNRPPIYDRAALSLTAEDRKKLESEGRAPHWRFKLSGKRVEWTDLVRGPVSIDTASLSDPVLIRADGAYLYTLPSVVDDRDFKMSHIIRGEDHVTNTGVQVEIFEALGGPVPAFGHFPLLSGADGGKLSKRTGSLSVEDLREGGFEPIAVLSCLAKIGTSDPVQIRASLDELAAEFSWDKIGRASARFDADELERLNAQVLHAMAYDQAKPHLIAQNADLGELFWNAARANIITWGGVGEWAEVVSGPINPKIDDPAFAAAALALLPPAPFGPDSWKGFTEAVKEKTGAKGKALFMPLRQALTGHDHGPDMAAMFQLIGPEKAAKRLAGEAA
jgi:glutamyl-tRNA synthetase